MKLIASTITKLNGKGEISADIIPPARSLCHRQPGRAGTASPAAAGEGHRAGDSAPKGRETFWKPEDYLTPAFVAAADAAASQGGWIQQGRR